MWACVHADTQIVLMHSGRRVQEAVTMLKDKTVTDAQGDGLDLKCVQHIPFNKADDNLELLRTC